MVKTTPRETSPPSLKRAPSVLFDIPNHVILTFSIRKHEDAPWGIRLVGGIKSISGKVYVKGIARNSACGLDSQLQIGDNILEVNGECMVGKTHEEAVEMFRKCGTDINLVVSRWVKIKWRADSSFLCSNQCGIVSRYRSNTIDEETAVMEHKPIKLPKNYSTTIW